jgi:hypothetical protein
MTISVVDLATAETIRGPMMIRVLEDGTNTDHRLGLVQVSIPPGVAGPPSTSTIDTTRPSTSCQATRASSQPASR